MGVTNPGNTIPTNSVKISVTTDTDDPIDEVTTGVIISPSVANAKLQSATLTRGSNVVGAPTSLTVVFKPTNTLTGTKYLEVSLPANVLKKTAGTLTAKFQNTAVTA